MLGPVSTAKAGGQDSAMLIGHLFVQSSSVGCGRLNDPRHYLNNDL